MEVSLFEVAAAMPVKRMITGTVHFNVNSRKRLFASSPAAREINSDLAAVFWQSNGYQ